MDLIEDTLLYIQKLRRDFLNVQGDCERSRQLIRASRQMMATVSQQSNSAALQSSVSGSNEHRQNRREHPPTV